jgi:hypothetical protein
MLSACITKETRIPPASQNSDQIAVGSCTRKGLAHWHPRLTFTDNATIQFTFYKSGGGGGGGEEEEDDGVCESSGGQALTLRCEFLLGVWLAETD